MPDARPPRDDLFRAAPGVQFRAADDDTDGDKPVMYGHFARFNEWTEIDSIFEGRFMEQIAPGAFKKTFREQAPVVLFNHGHDPTMGDQALGAVRSLREDGEGAYYEVDLFDGVPDLIVSGLRGGAYGASFRFRVMREEIVDKPGVSDHNPEGLPERTIKEVRCSEFGPVTFPAYKTATAACRSLTDNVILARFAQDPTKLRELIDAARTGHALTYQSEPACERTTPITGIGTTATSGAVTYTVRCGECDACKQRAEQDDTTSTPDAADEHLGDDQERDDNVASDTATQKDGAGEDPTPTRSAAAQDNPLYGIGRKEAQPKWLL